MKFLLSVLTCLFLASAAFAGACDNVDLNGKLQFVTIASGGEGAGSVSVAQTYGSSSMLLISLQDRFGVYNVFSVEGGAPGAPNEVVKMFAFMTVRENNDACAVKIEASPLAGDYEISPQSLSTPQADWLVLKDAGKPRLIIKKLAAKIEPELLKLISSSLK